MNTRSRYRIVPVGSTGTGWGLEVDGVIRRSSPRAVALAAYVDAVLAGASEDDLGYIAEAIEGRPWPNPVTSASGYPTCSAMMSEACESHGHTEALPARRAGAGLPRLPRALVLSDPWQR